MKACLIASVFALAAALPAEAADIFLPESAPSIGEQEVVVSEAGSWYLRGDAGYSFNKLRGAEFFQGNDPSEYVSFDNYSLKDSFLLGAGVGYQVNSYLRTDLTFDHTSSDFRGSTTGGGAPFGACIGPCTSNDRAKVHAYSLMANAYVDLGTYGSITPYIGAGIGGTRVKWSNLRNTSCADDGSGCDSTVEHGGRNSWRFTYALMAGASIDLTCNLKADVGYRFRHVAGGDMFGYAENGGPGRDRGFQSHEARIGARYLIGGCDSPVAAYDPPMESLIYK